MALTPPALVAGPPRTSLPHGLFSVLPFREGSTDRWQNGVLFEALGCNPETVKGIAAPCTPENETPTAEDVAENFPKTFEDGGLEQATATPFHIYETYTCSPIGNTLEHAEEVARARLANSEERLVERSLADGLFGAHPSINSDVADVEDLGHFGSAALAVGQLEQALAENYGGVGVLHVSRATAVVLLEDGVIRNRNGRLQTDLGTPVVAGSGYAFEGIIATPAMFGYRSEVFTSSNRPGDLLDRDTNDLYAVAERNYLIGIDPCGIWKATFAAGGSGGGGGPVDWEDVQNKPNLADGDVYSVLEHEEDGQTLRAGIIAQNIDPENPETAGNLEQLLILADNTAVLGDVVVQGDLNAHGDINIQGDFTVDVLETKYGMNVGTELRVQGDAYIGSSQGSRTVWIYSTAIMAQDATFHGNIYGEPGSTDLYISKVTFNGEGVPEVWIQGEVVDGVAGTRIPAVFGDLTHSTVGSTTPVTDSNGSIIGYEGGDKLSNILADLISRVEALEAQLDPEP